MEEISTINQPLQIYVFVVYVHTYAQQTIYSTSIHSLLENYIVPSFNVHREGIPKFIEIGPSSLLIQPDKFHKKLCTYGRHFFLLSFPSRTFTVGLREPQNIIFKISICTYTHVSHM